MYAANCNRLVAWAGLLLLVLAGCNRTPENVVHLSGTVTFDGKPLPIGMIIFEPDSSQGNLGSQGHAQIVDGKFDTRESQSGAAIGPQIVRISGGDGVNPESFSPMGKLLFEEHVVRMEISQGQAALALDVPQPKVKR